MSVEVHPAAVPFEKTFLKDHILEQLCSGRVLGDVLALEELRNGVLRRAALAADPTAVEEVERRLPEVLSLQDFFYEAWPDQQVYLPVPVFHVDTLRRYSELTELLQKDQSGRGIVLLARSGAGKTVAQRKAFCDCFYSKPDANAPPESNKPRLADHLPCWVNLRGRLQETDLIEYLLWDTAGLESSAAVPDTIRAWLDCGPPLLLFFDLNILGFEDRLRVADAIATFQASWAKHGHRCVVAYRSTVANDGLMDLLKADFEFYDMRPLLGDQAVSYLANIRRYEQRVYETLGLPWPERDVEGVVQQIRKLLTHMTGFGGHEESVISTPLLMHFASLLDPQTLARVETLTGLYDEVVNLHLDREQVKYAKARRLPLGRAGKELIRVAMTRTALAMLACGGTTSLREEDFDTLMREPDQEINGKRWWPDDPFWHQSSYYDSKIVLPGPVKQPEKQSELLKGLKEFSLLRRQEARDRRRNAGDLGFLHDSLISYFAAVGLREYRGANKPLRTGRPPAEWFSKAVRRMQQDAQGWLLPATFLGAMFSDEQFLMLARELVLAEPTPETPHLLWRLCRGIAPSLPTTPPHRIHVLGEAVLRDLPFLTRHPQALFQCLWNRCWWYDSPDAAKHHLEGGSTPPPWRRAGPKLYTLLEEWREAMEAANPGFSWLRSLRPLPDSLDGALRLVIRGHDGMVRCVAFSPDSKRIVSGSTDKTVRVWDPETGVELAVLRGHEEAVNSVAFSSDGRRIASGSSDRTVRLWDAEDYVPLAALQQNGSVTSVSYCPDSRRVASVCYGNKVRIWDGDTGECLTTTQDDGHVDDSQNDTEIDPLKKTNLAGDIGSPKNVHIPKVTLEDIYEILTFRPTAMPKSVTYSPDGRRVATVAPHPLHVRRRTVRVWDAESGAELPFLRGYAVDAVNSVAYSPDGRYIVTGEGCIRNPTKVSRNKVRLWDAESGAELLVIGGLEQEVRCVAYSPDGRQIAGASDSVRIWDAQTGSQLAVLDRDGGFYSSVAYSSDGRWIAGGCMDKTIRLWDAKGAIQSPRLRSHEGYIRALASDRDGRRISSVADEEVRVWDTATGVQLFVLDGRQQVAYSPDGLRIVTKDSRRNLLEVWDGESGRRLVAIEEHSETEYCVAYSPDGRRICGWPVFERIGRNPVKVWDAETGVELALLRGHEKAVTSVAYSPEGRRIATGSDDKTVRVWDAETGDELAILRGHEGEVTTVAYSLDGQRIASGSQDGTVPDSKTIRRLGRLYDHGDKTVRVWDGDTGECLEVIQGTGDVAAIVRGFAAFRALSRGPETVIEPPNGDKPIAWFHVPLENTITLPSLRSWAGSGGLHLYIVMLEDAKSP